MPDVRSLHRGAVAVAEYACGADAPAAPVTEVHAAWSISYVRRGSFGCTCRGRRHELVPGSILVGRPGDEYVCSHEHHHGGDVCLAFFFAPEVADEVRHKRVPWTSDALPASPALTAVADLAEAVLAGGHDAALDELGLLLAARYRASVGTRRRTPQRPGAHDRRRVVRSALWIDTHSAQPIALDAMAGAAGLSPFHYLRVFASVLDVTPHQYLVRCRLRNAARLLADTPCSVTDAALAAGFADLSNFVRTFRRTVGLTPGAFRAAARGNRKILQARLAPLA